MAPNRECALRTAITNASSSGKSVWVSAGTYKPTSGTDNTVQFDISGVSIYGGFAGGETALSQRILWRGNTTTISGDLNNNGTTDAADALGLFHHVSGSFLIDGIRFVNAGTGVSVEMTSFVDTIRNCSFSGMSNRGVLLYMGSKCWIEKSLFCDEPGATPNNEGILTQSGVNVWVRNSIFAGHTGTAIHMWSSSSVHLYLTNCTFVRNSGNPVINTGASTPDTMYNCILWHNTGVNSSGGKLYAVGSIIDTTGMDTALVNKLSGLRNDFVDPPSFVNWNSVLGPDNLLGGGDDGLLLQSGSYARTYGLSMYAPDDDILGNVRQKVGLYCTAGAYEQQ